MKLKSLVLAAFALVTLTVSSISATSPAQAAGTNSGSSWVSQFPGSTSVSDLSSPFKENVTNFISALNGAGISYSINATLRPPQRAYLMHWSWMITKQGTSPANVPALAGVDINWVHSGDDKNYTKSKAGALAMVNSYGIANLNVAPALNSNHTAGNAIDLATSWSASSVTITDANGKKVVINSGTKNSTNATLIDVAKTYGLIHYSPASDDINHFSTNGR